MTPMAADHCRATVSSFEFAVHRGFHNLIENELGESGRRITAALRNLRHLRNLRIFLSVEAELVALKNELYKFLRNPVDALLPSTIVPLISAVVRGLRSKDK